MSTHDAAGMVGVGLIVLAYLLLQTGRLAATAIAYSLLNAFGAALVLVSLAVEFNLSAFVMEAFWLLISLYGLARALRSRAATAPPATPASRP